MLSLTHTFQVYIETIDHFASVISVAVTYESNDCVSPKVLTDLESVVAKLCYDSYKLCMLTRLQTDIKTGLWSDMALIPGLGVQIRSYTLKLIHHYKIWSDPVRDTQIDTVHEVIHPDADTLEVVIEPYVEINNEIIIDSTEIDTNDRITALVEWNDSLGFSKATQSFRFKATSNDGYVCEYDLVTTFSAKEPFFEEELRDLIDNLILLYRITFRMQLFRDIVKWCENDVFDKTSKQNCLDHCETINTFQYKVRAYPDTKRLA